MMGNQYCIHWIMPNGYKGNGQPLNKWLCLEWLNHLKEKHNCINHYIVKYIK